MDLGIDPDRLGDGRYEPASHQGYPLAVRGQGAAPAGHGAFGLAVRDQLGRSLAGGALKVGVAVVVGGTLYLLGRLAWRGVRAWWESWRSGIKVVEKETRAEGPAAMGSGAERVERVDFGDGGGAATEARAPAGVAGEVFAAVSRSRRLCLTIAVCPRISREA